MIKDNVVSLAVARDSKKRNLESKGLEFQDLFNQARKLRLADITQEQDGLVVLDWGQARDFMQKEIADEVFAQKLFTRYMLMSIWYVSDLLITYAKGDFPEVGIDTHMRSYTENGNPHCLLQAANSAFLYFVFWPETRRRRSVQYRSLGSECGPSLFAAYGGAANKPIGFQMAQAFIPIGEIVRKRLR